MPETKSFHMTPDEFRAQGHAVVDWIAEYYRRIESFNDHPDTDHGQVVEVLERARDDLIAGRLAVLRSKPAAPVGWRARLTSWANSFRG